MRTAITGASIVAIILVGLSVSRYSYGDHETNPPNLDSCCPTELRETIAEMPSIPAKRWGLLHETMRSIDDCAVVIDAGFPLFAGNICRLRFDDGSGHDVLDRTRLYGDVSADLGCPQAINAPYMYRTYRPVAAPCRFGTCIWSATAASGDGFLTCL